MGFDDENVRRRVVEEEEEDRLSSLPDEVIHKILSFLDIKFGVQTCVLSSRWKLVWTTIPFLNFSTDNFRVLTKFDKFVNHVVSHRNHQIKVSCVNLRFRGTSVNPGFVKKLAKYVFSQDVEELNVRQISSDSVCPPCLFTSESLKHFTLICKTSKTRLDFPALTTLRLNCIKLTWGDGDGDLFSKCVNLKKLTLERFQVHKVFDIITPRLCSLILNNGYCSKTINVIAPKLQSLTMLYCSIGYLNVSPQLASFCYTSWVGICVPLRFSNHAFHSLNEASICLLCMYDSFKAYKEEDARKTINMLQKLHSVKYLTLGVETLECISSFPDLLSHHSSPFTNLISVTIDSNMRKEKKNVKYEVKMSTEATNFLLHNSPNATLIIKSPKVQSRSRR